MIPIVNGQRMMTPVKVRYDGTEQIRPGMALCFDAAASSVEDRDFVVAKPSLTNIKDFAGIAAPQRASWTGPGELFMYPVCPAITGVSVLTDENVAADDFLGPIPGSWFFGKHLFGTTPIFRSTRAVNGSVTPALVAGVYGLGHTLNVDQLATKFIRHFDHFDGRIHHSTTADLATYLLSGTSAAAAYADSFGPDQATAALRGAGVYQLTTNTTNQANITMNGEPFRFAEGCSAFFRLRFALDSIAANTQMFAGLGITDVAFMASKPTDYMGFELQAADLDFEFVKDGTTGVQSADVATLTANTMNEVAFMVRNRRTSASGAVTKDIKAWFNGTPITLANTETTDAEVVNDESLTFIFEILGDSARNAYLDLVEIANYIG